MLKHFYTYHRALKLNIDDFVPSELNGVQADNIYPILDLTSIPNVNTIENLIALTEDQFRMFMKTDPNISWLLKTHKDFLELSGVEFDSSWIENQIDKNS